MYNKRLSRILVRKNGKPSSHYLEVLATIKDEDVKDAVLDVMRKYITDKKQLTLEQALLMVGVRTNG